MHSFSTLRTVVTVGILALLLVLGAACGGSSGLNPPDPGHQPPPDPGLQPPPDPGVQQPPSEPVAELVDVSHVTASFDGATNQFTMVGTAGAVMADASVIVEDPQNFVGQVFASPDGAFEFQDADVPPNFLRVPGTQIRLYQFRPDYQRSEAAYVTIQAAGP